MEKGKELAMRQMKLTTVPYPRSTGAMGGQVVVCPSTFITDSRANTASSESNRLILGSQFQEFESTVVRKGLRDQLTPW